MINWTEVVVSLVVIIPIFWIVDKLLSLFKKPVIPIKFKRLHSLAQIPKQATKLAGGWDVVVTEIDKSKFPLVVCKLGFALQPPTGYKVTLVPRSSLTKTSYVLQNTPGLGDADYTGEYMLKFRGIPIGSLFGGEFMYDVFPYEVGDRIGQIYLEEVIPVEFVEVDELTQTERGTGGYGSTDRPHFKPIYEDRKSVV